MELINQVEKTETADNLTISDYLNEDDNKEEIVSKKN